MSYLKVEKYTFLIETVKLIYKIYLLGGRRIWEPIWGRFHISDRLGEMSEVAGSVAFLCSKDAGFVNGKQ